LFKIIYTLILFLGIDLKREGNVPSNNSKYSFTLIEILLVIVILGILFAILIPTLTRAREYAKQTACMNNMRQIALSFRTYMHQNEMEVPLVSKWLTDFRPTYPEVKSLGVYTCPSNENPQVSTEADLEENTDYYIGGTVADIERNCNYNNGLGNNDYNFDISNPSVTIKAIIAAKRDCRIIYEKRWDNHFGGESFNVLHIDDLHYEKERDGVAEYWTLNSKGWIDRSLDAFPDLD
jgi:prepilin-type N-terminal cleavage/methylation domain-containing protein